MQTYIFFGNNHLMEINFNISMNQPSDFQPPIPITIGTPIWWTFLWYVSLLAPHLGGWGGKNFPLLKRLIKFEKKLWLKSH